MRRISILVSMLVALFALTCCGETHSWRQKTILEVETPNGIVIGGLKDIKLEITGEAVTAGEIEKVVKWIHSPTYLKKPTWAKLPSLTQQTISGLVRPSGVK